MRIGEHPGARARLTELDLTDTPPPFLMPDSLNALIKRNYTDSALNQQEQLAIEPIEAILQQFLTHDRIVVAYPMHNFSVPAPVKAWLDCIVQVGRTFRFVDGGGTEGLCTDKQALLLITTGGDYGEGGPQAVNLSENALRFSLQLMGVTTHAISAFGLDAFPQQTDTRVLDAQTRLGAFLESGGFLQEHGSGDRH